MQTKDACTTLIDEIVNLVANTDIDNPQIMLYLKQTLNDLMTRYLESEYFKWEIEPKVRDYNISIVANYQQVVEFSILTMLLKMRAEFSPETFVPLFGENESFSLQDFIAENINIIITNSIEHLAINVMPFILDEFYTEVDYVKSSIEESIENLNYEFEGKFGDDFKNQPSYLAQVSLKTKEVITELSTDPINVDCYIAAQADKIIIPERLLKADLRLLQMDLWDCICRNYDCT